MGRKSALSADQWVQIERRHVLNGESINSLALEFGVNESSIRRKIKTGKAESPNERPKRANALKSLAIQKAVADKQSADIAEKISLLPFAKQEIVMDLSRKLRNTSEHLACAAEFGAATAHRLHAMANAEVQKVDDANPLASMDALKGVKVLTDLANAASTIPINLIAANKSQVADAFVPRPESPPLDATAMSDGTLKELVRLRAAGAHN